MTTGFALASMMPWFGLFGQPLTEYPVPCSLPLLVFSPPCILLSDTTTTRASPTILSNIFLPCSGKPSDHWKSGLTASDNPILRSTIHPALTVLRTNDCITLKRSDGFFGPSDRSFRPAISLVVGRTQPRLPYVIDSNQSGTSHSYLYSNCPVYTLLPFTITWN